MSGLSEKVDFGDFYKFCVSLGLGLIVASCAVPWLVLKDASLLEHKPVPIVDWTSSNLRQELAKIPPEALVEARGRRVDAVASLYALLPWFSGVFLVLGLLFFLFGLLQWRARQLGRDKKENKEIERALSDAMPPGSSAEVDAKNNAEAELEGDDGPGFSRLQIRDSGETGAASNALGFSVVSRKAKYSWTERGVLGKLRVSFGHKYGIYTNRKLGSSLLDGLMISKSEVRADLIVEVKVIRQGFGSSWLHEVLQGTSRLVDLYEVQFDRLVRGLVVIVLEGEAVEWIGKPGTMDWVSRRAEGSPLVNVRLVPIGTVMGLGRLEDSFIDSLPQVSFVN